MKVQSVVLESDRRHPIKLLHVAMYCRQKQSLITNVEDLLCLVSWTNWYSVFLQATQYKGGGGVNSAVSIGTVKALTERYPNLERSDIVIGRPYALNLFRQMNFVRKRTTTGKVQIPTGALKEAELNFQHRIVSIVEKSNIPPSLQL